MIALRPRDQHVWDRRPVPHETEAENKTNYCETETETETKKVVSRPQYELWCVWWDVKPCSNNQSV